MEKETNSTELKTNWFKSHLAICVICAVLIIAAVVGVFLFMSNQGDSPEDVAKKYVQAMNDSDSNGIVAITDIKGAYAWEKSKFNKDKFLEVYNSTSDADVEKYKDTFKNSLDSAMALAKVVGGLNFTLKDVEKSEELAKGLYKVKVNMTMTTLGKEQTQSTTLVIYKGKYIGQISQ